MYHYVRPFDKNYPNLKILTFDNFKRQLDYFQNEFGFVSKNEFIKSLETGKPKKGVILTFDDAFSCHYNFVFKELKKRGLWAIFYISSQPYIQGRLLDVHRTHLLLAKFESKIIFDALNKEIDKFMFDKSRFSEFKSLTYTNQINDKYTLLVKRALNYYISYEYREHALNKLMLKFIPNEKEILQDFYLTKGQILKMHENGIIIGSHTVNHPVMSRLNEKDKLFQIKSSFNFLENLVKQFHHKTSCYPYGGFHSFTNQTEVMLSEEKCMYSFNVEDRDIEEVDLRFTKQALPRYDCDQFSFGYTRNPDRIIS